MSDVVTCPSCGSQYLSTATVCADCGAPLSVSPILDPSDAEVGYDLGDWGDDERLGLASTLTAEAIPSRWEGTELVVRDTDADHVEVLIQEIDDDEGLAADEDGAGDAGAEILSSLYVSSDVLQSDPKASAAIVELIDACELASQLGPPYGLEKEAWQLVQRLAADVAELLGEGAEDEDVASAAKTLRDAVRPLV